MKKIYQLLLLSALLGMVGCESGQNGGVLSVEEMVPIVKDLQIAYAGVDATIQKPEDRPPKYEEMNTLILAKHQMDKETFFDSFSFYQENPALMDSIFKNVVDEINQDIVDLDKNKGGKQRNNPQNPPVNQ